LAQVLLRPCLNVWRTRREGVVVKTLPFGAPFGGTTIGACFFARAIDKRTESGMPIGRYVSPIVRSAGRVSE